MNRLAHDGTNGLWIYTHFSELLASVYFPEYGKHWERQIEKLRKVVKKCRKYGIKVYVFGVEPEGLSSEMKEKYKDVAGRPGHIEWWGERTSICTYSERGAGYCREATRRLTELIPELGGVIDITSGECVTSCLPEAGQYTCSKCQNKGKSEVLAHVVDLFREGMRENGTQAEFISWTYDHREWKDEDIIEYIKAAPDDVMLMENFEDNGYAMQLGKMRQAIDYWLSYVGPSQMFQLAAKTAQENGKHMFAKMQVCCSHELATVPYIPVPGILFDKYAAAYKYGVEGVMQCWYFGNYPCLMSKVAGELAFTDNYDSKRDFLEQIAGIYYGQSEAAQAVDAWEHFERGYTSYPLNIMFSYYGPIHDGVVWELSLLPKNRALPQSWQLFDRPDGDRIGECLQSGHTLEEAIRLTAHMKEEWGKGRALLPDNVPDEQKSVAAAIEFLIKSGNNILKFYQLREILGIGKCDDSMKLLDRLEALVDQEIDNSREMEKLCRQDSRLGYHSEAEGFKYFPEKLLDRIEKLKKLKKTDFVQVRERIRQGKPPLSYYEGDFSGYHMAKGCLEDADYICQSQETGFRVAYDTENIYVELKGKIGTAFTLCFEYRLMWPSPEIHIENGNITLSDFVITHQSIWGEKIQRELDKYPFQYREKNGMDVYLFTISRAEVGWMEDVPLKLRLAANDIPWIMEEEPVHTLGKTHLSPGEFIWLMP